MKLRTLSTLAFAGSLLSSCIYYTTPVPEMPYQPYRRTASTVPPLTPMPQTDGVWQTTAPANTAAIPDPYVGAAPAPVPAPAVATPAPAPKPAAAPAAPARPTSTITQTPLKLNPPATPAAKPITVKPAAAPKPATTPAHATTAANPADITNKGPIPVATPVPGDPTRVYNPLDSSKTIRITDKNGKVYPSGKELKVRGTNFHFYVP